MGVGVGLWLSLGCSLVEMDGFEFRVSSGFLPPRTKAKRCVVAFDARL